MPVLFKVDIVDPSINRQYLFYTHAVWVQMPYGIPNLPFRGETEQDVRQLFADFDEVKGMSLIAYDKWAVTHLVESTSQVMNFGTGTGFKLLIKPVPEVNGLEAVYYANIVSRKQVGSDWLFFTLQLKPEADLQRPAAAMPAKRQSPRNPHTVWMNYLRQ